LIHAQMFSGHGAAAAFAFFGFSGIRLLKERAGAGGTSPGAVAQGPSKGGTVISAGLVSFLSGLAAGLAALCDYTAMVLALLLSLYALFSPLSKRCKALFFCGGALCAAVLAAYNWRCFGSPLSFSYAFQVTRLFAEQSKRGLLGIGLPGIGPLAALLLSPSRGLLVIMPVFLLSLFGLWDMVRRRILPAETLLILAAVVGYLLINAGFYGWHGGWAYGPRYLVPMFPFLALCMVFAPRHPLVWGSLLGISALQVHLAAVGLPHTPPQIKNPLMELVLPCLREGYLADTWPGWLGVPAVAAIPLYATAVALLAGIAWHSAWRQDLPEGGRSGPWPSPSAGKAGLAWTAVLLLGLITSQLLLVRTAPPSPLSYYRNRLLSQFHNRDRIDAHIASLAEAYRKARETGDTSDESRVTGQES
ncbi:MAG: hypothetical protein JW821_10360, partial [Deltaproteobacteria bacterium]|nr:hypothetical protein [Deltaproteobacteria bacterium]